MNGAAFAPMFELDRKGCAVRVIVGQQPPAHAGTWPESATACMMKVSSFIQSRLDTVVRDSDVAVLSRRDAEGNAVVMSLDHYNSLMETLHLLSTPANAAALARAIRQDQACGTQPRTSLALGGD